ncbi:hypothetical protein SGLAM104S_00127 [Streptomyces glaucescens]
MARHGCGSRRTDRSGSHCTRTGLSATWADSSRSVCTPDWKRPRAECASAHSKPARSISTRRTRSWPGFRAQPQRYIIHRNDGLIDVMRSRLNGCH